MLYTSQTMLVRQDMYMFINMFRMGVQEQTDFVDEAHEAPSLQFPKLETVAKVLVRPPPSDQGGLQGTLCQGHPGRGAHQGVHHTTHQLHGDLEANPFSQSPTPAPSSRQQGSRWPAGQRSPLREPTFLSGRWVLALEASFISGAHMPSRVRVLERKR